MFIDLYNKLAHSEREASHLSFLLLSALAFIGGSVAGRANIEEQLSRYGEATNPALGQLVSVWYNLFIPPHM